MLYRVITKSLLHVRLRLEKEAEELSKAGDSESERLMDVYERLEELDAATAETKAARILHGLGKVIFALCFNFLLFWYVECTA